MTAYASQQTRARPTFSRHAAFLATVLFALVLARNWSLKPSDPAPGLLQSLLARKSVSAQLAHFLEDTNPSDGCTALLTAVKKGNFEIAEMVGYFQVLGACPPCQTLLGVIKVCARYVLLIS